MTDFGIKYWIQSKDIRRAQANYNKERFKQQTGFILQHKFRTSATVMKGYTTILVSKAQELHKQARERYRKRNRVRNACSNEGSVKKSFSLTS